MLPHELFQSWGFMAPTLGHGLCPRCSWGRWGPETSYPLPPGEPLRLHKNRKGEISHVQVNPPSLRVCPTRRAAVWSPDEQLSASRP